MLRREIKNMIDLVLNDAELLSREAQESIHDSCAIHFHESMEDRLSIHRQ